MANIAKQKPKKKFAWICGDCGNLLGRYQVGSSDWKERKCSNCDKKKTVTRGSDFGL